MPRFFAVHTLPDLTEEGVRKSLEDGKPADPRGVEWRLTYCAFDEHKFYCEWVAPDKATVQRVLDDRNIPVETIYAVKLLDWRTKTYE
ncbi:MAG: DUF4242 domain-containing protein [Lysobacterales bacterium]|nr:MAG: DUF4242 domain-containing protein [Xanthomonadales bacterium]